MSKMKVTAGPFVFEGRLETDLAPKTCAAFLTRSPFESKVVHVRWSGEGVWIPLGDYNFDVGYENPTSYPAPARSSSIPAGSARRKFCSPTAACASPPRSASSRAAIS